MHHNNININTLNVYQGGVFFLIRDMAFILVSIKKLFSNKNIGTLNRCCIQFGACYKPIFYTTERLKMCIYVGAVSFDQQRVCEVCYCEVKGQSSTKLG